MFTFLKHLCLLAFNLPHIKQIHTVFALKQNPDAAYLIVLHMGFNVEMLFIHIDWPTSIHQAPDIQYVHKFINYWLKVLNCSHFQNGGKMFV